MDFLSVLWANDFARASVSFIFILGVIVFVHELGHYVVARYNDVRVEVFSIGFGRDGRPPSIASGACSRLIFNPSSSSISKSFSCVRPVGWLGEVWQH
ncbi:MAG: site-2 protease family protein [Proteobacteria bacterium]|nr:site-2 protease family protein [Pseudomonadota bacterium]